MEFQTRFISREDRRISRQSLTGKHGFQALVQASAGSISAALTDFSSLGFAITLGEDRADSLKVGDAIQVWVSPLINHSYEIKGVIIDKQKSRNQQVKISAVIEHEQSCKHEQFQPIHLSAEQSLKGVMVHPFMYRQNSYFEIESISRNGFYATNINSDFTLFNGMELIYSLGSIQDMQNIQGRISNVSLNSDNKIRCFIETPNLSPQAEMKLSQHCFHYTQKTPKDINGAGLRTDHLQELVQYRFVETQAEYEAVLKLRRKSYASMGMCSKEEPIAKFAMEQDAYGRILIVFHNERVIGSALLVFGERGVKPFEMDGLLPISQVSKLPNYDEIMEITAICIERTYHETDVLHGVFEHMYREGLSAGKNYVIVASTPELMPRYARMGFKAAQLSFTHPRKADLTMQVMVLNKETGKTGKGMNPLHWWQVWGYVSLHLYQRRIIEYTPTQKLRVYVNRALFELVGTVKRAFQSLSK